MQNHEPIELHTTDRNLFRQCRRKWDWESKNRRALIPVEGVNKHFWFGTGFHFALEDFHGHHKYPTPGQAFLQYVAATPNNELPNDHKELTEMGVSLLHYYTDYWLPTRDSFQTFYFEGEPQVEVNFKIPIPGLDPSKVVYSGTFDRVVIDAYDQLWIEDYKTTAAIDTQKLDIDPQATAYSWAAEQLYGNEVAGLIWTQFLKKVPKLPKRLKNGEFSINKATIMTYPLYREAVLKEHGKIPQTYVEFLNFLADKEDEHGDRFIRRTQIHRNQHQIDAELVKIQQEYSEMSNPELPLYPNPRYDCSRFCNFRAPCLAADDGSDVDYFLENEFKEERYREDSWRHTMGVQNPVYNLDKSQPLNLPIPD